MKPKKPWMCFFLNKTPTEEMCFPTVAPLYLIHKNQKWERLSIGEQWAVYKPVDAFPTHIEARMARWKAGKK